MPAKQVRLQSKQGRKSLAPRREPYWSRVAAGRYLGFRKLAEGQGTWIARWRDESGNQRYRALGHFEDFDDAKKDAEAWFQECARGANPTVTTIEEACRAYVANLRTEKGANSAKDAEGRFRRLVYQTPLGRIPLDKLTTSSIRKWRDANLDGVDEDDDDELRRAKDSANRNLSSLKAALNFALRDRMVATDAGWKTVTAFRNVGSRRKHFLTADERRALLDKCPPDLRIFASAMLLTAARPGELASLNVCDFDMKQGTLALDGKTGKRIVSLSTAATSFFAKNSGGRIGNAALLVRADGARWNKDAWKSIFKEAVRAAGLPDDVVVYSLRHTAISEFISSGMDSFIVARLAGTSTAMIDKYYGHLRHDRTRAKLDEVRMI